MCAFVLGTAYYPQDNHRVNILFWGLWPVVPYEFVYFTNRDGSL